MRRDSKHATQKRDFMDINKFLATGMFLRGKASKPLPNFLKASQQLLTGLPKHQNYFSMRLFKRKNRN